MHSKFNELFIKTDLLERKHGEGLRLVFDLRQTSDYDLDAALTGEDAAHALEIAAELLAAVQQLLGK